MSQNILDFFKNHWQVAAIVILIGAVFYIYEAKHQAELGKVVQMNEQKMQDINALQNELNMSRQNAEGLKELFSKVQAGQVQPVTHVTVQAPSLPAAAAQVQQRINSKDPSLPPAALEKTDRTVVVQQPNNKDYQVGVYKTNLYRNWEWGIGVGTHSGNAYIPIELQRNYSRDRAIAAEVHVGTNGQVNGGELKYKIMTDKLFGLF